MRTYTFTSAELDDYGFDYPIKGTLDAWLDRTLCSLRYCTATSYTVLDSDGRKVGIASMNPTEGRP